MKFVCVPVCLPVFQSFSSTFSLDCVCDYPKTSEWMIYDFLYMGRAGSKE